VSNDLYHLIAIGSALQKQAGCEVYLGRGSSDALAQLERHAPAAVLLDIRLYEHESRELLTRIATIRPAPHIMLIVEEHEANHVPTIQSPKISGVLKKPVQLLTLTEDVRKATGLVYGSAREKAASGLQNEIVRVMQITLGDGI
jgi:DNA-binding NarL/FixJ family response regulator